jgi:exonuclease SbcC
MPRGTVSVEAEAKRLGVVLDFEPSVRREHKQLRAQKRAEEKIEKKLTEENDISEQAHIETKIDLQNNFDYFISLFFALVSENESIKKQLDDMQKELVEQNKIIPKENEVAIGRKLYEEIEKIQDKFSHLDPEGLYEKILLSEDDYTRDISTLEIKVKELNKNVYSEHDQNVNGKSTGKKLTNKELVSILENDTTKQKKQIEKLEDALVEFEIEQKEKIEAKDNETLSLNQQIRELKKDVLSEDWTQTDNNGNKHKSKNIDVVKYLEKKRTELKEKIGELETENNILTTTLEQKETQIASDSTTLKDSQEKIKVLEKQVQELKDKEPEIIEVIKEVSIELTPEEIMQLVIETEHGSMKIEDVIEKQKEEISNQKESINSIYGEIYHDDGIDKPVSYKNLWEKEKNKLVTEKPYKTSEADQKEIDKLKNLLVLELEKKPKEQPEEMVMAEVPNEQGEIEHKEVTIKLYNSILEAKINQIRDDVSFWKRIATKYLLSLEIDIDQSREYIEKEVDNKLWEKLSTSEKVLKLEELARQWQITYDSGEATDDNDVFMKKGDKIKGDLVVERAKLSNEQKRTKNKKTLTGVNEGMGENLKTVKIKKTQGNSSNRL